MTITLTYFGQLKTAVGHGSEDFEVDPSSTLSELIHGVAAKYSDAARRLIVDTHGEVQKSLLLIVNDEQVPPGGDIQLRPGDRVTLMLPISGGCV